jgi:hypothetical protein
MVDFEHRVAMIKGIRADQKDMKDKMNSKVEAVKASHKKIEATMKTNQKQSIAKMKDNREEIKAIRGA